MKHESTEMRRVLFISYSFPPSTEMGAYSCAQIARYLPLYGWEPVVLTVREKHIDDIYLGRNDEGRVNDPDLVIRTYKLPHPSDIYRRFKSRPPAGKPPQDSDRKAVSPPNGAKDKSALRASRDLLHSLSCVPDKYNGWLIPAVAAGLRAIKQTRAVLICSSAPYFNAERRPDKICFKINRALERMTISRADAVVCVTEEHAALMRAAYDQMPASKFAVVMNGFDGLEWQEFIESIPPGDPGEGYAADAPRKFRITYAGNLYMNRDPAPLFRALRTLIECGEIVRDEVSVELIGSCESSEGRGMADIVSEAGIEGCVEMTGMLSHSETLRRLLQSDLLLLLAEGLVIQIPGKTFEYLKTRRPILALTCEGAVATLLRRTGGAWVVSPDDQQGVINAVRECYRLWKCGLPGPAPDPLIVESFDRRRTTARIAELLDFLTL